MTMATESPYAALKRLFHEPSRMAIVTVLCGREEGCTFNELKTACTLTDGNLNRHLKALADAGAVEIKKVTRASRYCTRVKVTSAGRYQFIDYLRSLEEVLRHASRSLAAQDGRQEQKEWPWPVVAAGQ